MSTALKNLQKCLQEQRLQGFVVPSGDEFIGEYVPASARRLEWLTGFTGSAGFAVVLQQKCAFFTDGRYTLQAKAQVKAFERYNIAEITPEDWMATHAKGATIGYDPRLHTMAAIKRLRRAAAVCEFKAVTPNPIDGLWKNRPAAPASALFIHDTANAGLSSAKKRAAIGANLKKQQVGAAVLVASDSVNWLLNIRAQDLEYTPVALAPAIVMADGGVKLFIEDARVSTAVRKAMGTGVAICPPAALEKELQALSKQRVLCDPQLTPVWFADVLGASGAQVVEGTDPCQLPKALKNEVELDGIRSAHVRDGLAVTRFLHWIDQTANRKGLDELGVDAQLQTFRRMDKGYVCPSFATIAGFGANGAIVHYQATKASSAKITNGNLLLLDSGGQYAQGTTDITRTMVIGKVSAAQRKHFTLVLKGHIALAMASFPPGTSGGQLDVLARHALWQEGLDYDHGTGHGVGMFLSVHEGPQRISKKGSAVALQPGMVLSNEPGYYKAGAYGIRIENLVAVVPQKKGMLGFETLTLVPIDRRLVEVALLSATERAWLNGYHKRVLKTHLAKLDKKEAVWLKKACAPL